MTGTSTICRSPSFMIEPLPNCRSICETAKSTALVRSFDSIAMRDLRGRMYRDGETKDRRKRAEVSNLSAKIWSINPSVIMDLQVLKVDSGGAGPYALRRLVGAFGTPITAVEAERSMEIMKR